jgi:hypothetical protein
MKLYFKKQNRSKIYEKLSIKIVYFATKKISANLKLTKIFCPNDKMRGSLKKALKFISLFFL